MISGRPFRVTGNVEIEGRIVRVVGLLAVIDDPAPQLSADLLCDGHALYGASSLFLTGDSQLTFLPDAAIETTAGAPGFATRHADGYSTDSAYIHAILGGQNIAIPFTYE